MAAQSGAAREQYRIKWWLPLQLLRLPTSMKLRRTFTFAIALLLTLSAAEAQDLWIRNVTIVSPERTSPMQEKPHNVDDSAIARVRNCVAYLSADVGTVQVGKRANLLLLHADPSKTVDAYDRIEKIILRGQVLDPHELAANR
jgi:hypothetical protein